MKKIFLCIIVGLFVAVTICGFAIAAGSKCNDYTFDATKSRAMGGQKLNYTWDFGDGTTSDNAVVTHHYDKAGQYNVRLIVTDQSGLPCDNASTSQTVKVNAPPKAVFNGPDILCTGSEVTFDASATTSDSSRNLTYNWTFGDGTSAEGMTVKKVFEKSGSYKVQLIVDDNQGTECSTDCAYLNIKVNAPPTATAGKDIIRTCLKSSDAYVVAFSGSGSDPDGDKLNYTWNFGDGESASGSKATHTYTNSGTYKATLIVDDGSGTPCSTASDTISVVLSKGPQANAGEAVKACTGQSVSFDGSNSIVESGDNTTYTWDFGDGATGTGVRTSHDYAKGGRYNAVLTVDNGECKSSSVKVVELNSPPKALLAKADAVCIGDKVMLDASASSDPDGDHLKYIWDFGEGTIMEGNPTECRIYEKCGTYTVKVTVSDGKGTPCSVDEASTIVKVNGRPYAVIAPSDACCVGATAMFDGSGSSSPCGESLTYSWDFGDGNTATGAKVTHVYTAPGRYKVTLKVDDGTGSPCSTAYAVREVSIHESPEAVISVR